MLFRPIAIAAVLISGFGMIGCHKKQVAAKAPEPAPAPVVRENPPPPVAATAPRSAPSQTQAAPAQPRYPDQKTLDTIDQLLARIQDAYFDYDKHTLRPDAEQALHNDAQTLAEIIRRYPDFKLNVEGHCDDRGSDEYNLALGDARAKQAKEYLTALGLPGNQLETISYGKHKPVCMEADESCWQKNRRAHVAVPAAKGTSD